MLIWKPVMWVAKAMRARPFSSAVTSAPARERSEPMNTSLWSGSGRRGAFGGYWERRAPQVLVFDPQLGIRRTANALPAVLVDTLLRHPVRAMDAPRDVLSASRAHAPRQPEARALLGHPRLALRPVHHVWHAVAHLGR